MARAAQSGRPTVREHEVAGAGADAASVKDAAQTRTGGFGHVARHLWRQAAVDRRPHNGGGQDVVRCLFEGGCHCEHLVRILTRRNLDRQQARSADSQGSGLVEQNRMGTRQRFERAAALDQDAEASGARDAGDEGNRGSQDERTRRRRHEYGEAANWIA